jgi:hypothetical protein
VVTKAHWVGCPTQRANERAPPLVLSPLRAFLTTIFVRLSFIHDNSLRIQVKQIVKFLLVQPVYKKIQ